MRARGHSRGKIKVTEKGQKTLPSKMKLLSQSLRTSADLERQLNELNIPLIDVEELLEDNKDVETVSDVAEDADITEIDDESEGFEDENVDYDEIREEDPFDIESDGKNRKGVYLAEVMSSKGVHSVSFLRLPVVDTTDAVVNGAVTERNKVFREMAVFLATKQKKFFNTPKMDNIANLNQEELVKDLNAKGYKLSKGHISRLLDSLSFRVSGMGEIPSRLLFKRYGHKTGLSKDERLKLAVEFLEAFNKDASQLKKAKGFWKYLKDKKGIEIKLPLSDNENDRFRNLKNIIRDAEKVRRD